MHSFHVNEDKIEIEGKRKDCKEDVNEGWTENKSVLGA